MIGSVHMCIRGWIVTKRDEKYSASFMGTAQFYVYNARKATLAKQVEALPEVDYEVDGRGVPLALSGDALYPAHVLQTSDPLRPAKSAFGAGRLQRLWLATSGARATPGRGLVAGGAKGEKRLRRIAAMRPAPTKAVAAEPAADVPQKAP